VGPVWGLGTDGVFVRIPGGGKSGLTKDRAARFVLSVIWPPAARALADGAW